MCGIAGMVGFSKAVEPCLLAAMNRLLAHRGPDDAGEWVSATRTVGLASRRLAILDLSAAGHQPMVGNDRADVIAFNGEIYNYLEVRDELIRLGHVFRTQTDTEVVLAAYAAWGESCVERFNGMFALAIWDSGKRQLFAARDRFGEKPFYFHHTPARFVFASELKALLLDDDVPRRPDLAVVSRYLLTAQLDGDTHTFFDGVQQLAPAHTLVVRADGEVRTRRYWSLALETPPQVRPAGDLIDEFRRLLFDSIRLRLRSDIAVGSSLSGGLDSSSIVCALRTLLGDRATAQNTFSARYRSGGTDEGRYIHAVVAQTGVTGHEVFIDGDRLTDDLERFLWFQDEPVAHTSQYAQWKVMELAKRVGVTVLLDGQGADEILGGYPSPTFGYRYADIARRGHLIELVSELAAFRRNHGGMAPALRYAGAALLPPRLRRVVRRLVHNSGALVIRDAPSVRDWQPAQSADAPMLRRALYETLTFSSLPGLLRYGDRNSMAHSREARLPFLDHRLVEFAYALPPELLVRNGTSKVVLREAMRGIIPDLVRERMDKIGFGTPEREWFTGPLRPWLQDALAGLKRRQLLDAGAIDGQWRSFLSGGRSGNVWRLANLEWWFRNFIDARPSAATARAV
jgi:asparagine synthase (glutamine-hydrolysing)